MMTFIIICKSDSILWNKFLIFIRRFIHILLCARSFVLPPAVQQFVCPPDSASTTSIRASFSVASREPAQARRPDFRLLAWFGLVAARAPSPVGTRALPSCFVHFDLPKASPRQASIFFVSVVSARSSFLGLAQDARGQGFLLPLLILVGHQERCADARTVPVPFGLTLFVMQQYSCFELCSSSDLVSVSLSPDFLS
jgi:hypothetical protein